MNRDSIKDYLSYILFKLLGRFFRALRKTPSLFLARRIGELLYYTSLKRRAVVYSNLKTAFGDKLSADQLTKLTREFYRTLLQNLIEVFFTPSFDRQHLNRYITFEGLNNIFEGFKKGKGVILLAVHEGSWELSNVICANLGFAFTMLVRDQAKFKRLEGLLNSYRKSKGCKLLFRQNQTRQLVETLKNNEAVGMTMDQGGAGGVLVKFFGRSASMASGAVRLALRYGTVILPVYFRRLGGSCVKIIIEPAFQLKKTGDEEKDIRDNLQELTFIFEKYISLYPQEYLWSYKIWKYGRTRKILILSDGKAGHLRQAQAAAGIVGDSLLKAGMEVKTDVQAVEFKNKFSKSALGFSCLLTGKYQCQGCAWCLRQFLKQATYESLGKLKPDIVISCGSSLAPVNYILCRQNLAKSIVIMRPSFLSMKRFDLVIMPEHDRPPRKKNVVVTEGALNLINENYLKEESEKLLRAFGFQLKEAGLYIGLLIGGDAKNFCLKKDAMLAAVKQIKSAAEKLNMDILLTTSRRTSKEIEGLLKEEFKDYPRCKLLIIANEKNIPQAVGGILGLSQVVVTTPESISMISEAASSKKYVLIFQTEGLSRKHRRFLKHFAQHQYIYLTKPRDLGGRIEELWLNKPQRKALSDNLLIQEAVKKLL